MKNRPNNILKLIDLLGTKSFVNGEDIGKELGVSRASIWKMISYLRNEGIDIISIKGKGYRLVEPLIFVNEKYIQSQLDMMDLDTNIKVFESIKSTNLFEYKLSEKNQFNICISEKQTDGVGRFKRQWFSPYARNIYMSLRYTLSKDISELSGLSLIIAVAVLDSLKEFGIHDDILIKWPNDILYNDAKLCGISMDVRGEVNSESEITIGIGINVNMPETNPLWTSLQKITGVYIDRNNLIVLVLKNLFAVLNDFENNSFKFFLNRFNNYNYLKGKQIGVESGNKKYSGQCIGVNELGHLLIDYNNKIISFSSANTSILKK